MIVSMKPDASEKDISYVISRVHSLGLEAYVSDDGDRTLINIQGDLTGVSSDVLLKLRGVEKVVSLDTPFPHASRASKPTRTLVRVGEYLVGGDQIVVMAGPCAVESRGQLLRTARLVREAGAHMLRGGAFKPRTSPYSFQGLGEDGLRILAEAREATGLPVVTEVMSVELLPLVSAYADVLQIGARNMQNYQLLSAVGRIRKPVLLKRGMMATLQELLLSAEYILSQGNQDVILCERGIRTFDTSTRNTLDITAVPLLKKLTHLPVVVDPSHATGRADLVKPASKAAIAAGADGLLIEVHPDPETALSDGYQSVTPQVLQDLLSEGERVARSVDRFILSDHRRSAEADSMAGIVRLDGVPRE